VIASLLVAAAITYAIVLLLAKAAGFTLTLPGIAGLIVAVGITADSFIVYFERIRDEMRDGKSMRVAVEAGWKRARNTCLAADAVSLLAAVVLYIFAAGVVRGFAFALGISTSSTSWCSSGSPTRWSRGWRGSGSSTRVTSCPASTPRRSASTDQPRHRDPDWADRGREGLMGMFSRLGNDLYTGKKSIDFVGRKWLWYSGSGLIVLLAVCGLYFQGLNMGIEFEGGAQYRVTLPSDQVTQDNADKLREAVAATGIDGASSPVVTTTGDNGIIVQTKQLNSADSQEVVDTILRPSGRHRRHVAGRDRGELGSGRRQAVLHRLVVFLILVVLFIWAYFREWKMSVAALVALAHDVLITVGVYACPGSRSRRPRSPGI
jgi:preprotein translocase subunit SecF